MDNPCFDQIVSQMYPTELQFNKANSSDTDAPDGEERAGCFA